MPQIPDLDHAIERFNRGCEYYHQAITAWKTGDIHKYEVDRIRATTEALGTIEWILKIYMEHYCPRSIPRTEKRKLRNVPLLLQLMEKYADPPLQRGISRRLKRYWDLRNAAIHEGRPPLSKELHNGIKQVRKIFLTYLPIKDTQLHGLIDGSALDGLEQPLEDLSVEAASFILEYLNHAETREKTRILSLSTGEVVEYTPLRLIPDTEEITDEPKRSRAASAKTKAAVQWWEDEGAQGLLLGLPGQGKSSFLKHLFGKKLADCLTGREERVCVFADFTNYFRYPTGNDWLIGEAFPEDLHGSLEVVSELINAGKLMVFCDAWDEVPPSRRFEAERFLSKLFSKKNRITISSRVLPKDQFPKYRHPESGSREDFPLPVATLTPLVLQDLVPFLKARVPTYTGNQLLPFLNQLEKSPVALYPLWIDLLAKLPSSFEGPLTEVILLDQWITHSDWSRHLLDNLDKIEALAFSHLTRFQRTTLTQDYAEIVEISPQLFRQLTQKPGWLVPARVEKGKEAFEFVHLQVKEYLAARYLWRNWAQLTEPLFDRTTGLLSRPNHEALVELAVLEGQRRPTTSPETMLERLYEIAGEPGWEGIDGKCHLARLRNPFLASYLVTALNLPTDSWVVSLDQFLREFWTIYRKQSPYTEWRSWIEKNQVQRALLARIPEELLFESDEARKHPFTTFGLYQSEFQLADPVFDRIIETLAQHRPPIWDKPQEATRFFRILRWKTNREKWHPQTIAYLEDHIETPSEAVTWALGCVDVRDLKQLFHRWSLSPDPQIRQNCAGYISYFAYPEFIQAHSEFILELIDHWLSDNVETVQIAANNLLEDLLQIQPEHVSEHLARRWLQSPMQETRERAMDVLVAASQQKLLTFAPTKLFAELHLDFPGRLQSELPWVCNNIDFSDPEADSTLKWFCQKVPLSSVIDYLRHRRDFPTLLEKIAQFIPGPVDEAEAKDCLRWLPFYLPEAKSFAKGFLSAAGETLERFLTQVELYSNLEQGIPLNTQKIQALVQNDPEALVEVLEDLRWAPGFPVERLSRGITVLCHSVAKIPPTLLKWVVQHPIGLIPELLHAILQSEDEALQNQLASSLIWKLEVLRQTNKLSEIIPPLLNALNEYFNPRLEYTAALLVEFLPPAEKQEALQILATYPSAPLRAIGLRLEAEAVNVRIGRVMSKTAICLRSNTEMVGRPLLDGYDKLSSFHTIGLISFTPWGLSLSRRINFGLLITPRLGIIPEKGLDQQPTGRSVPLIYREDYALLLDWEDFENALNPVISRLHDWSLPDRLLNGTQVFGEDPEHQWALRGLREMNLQNLRATLFYLEDILYQQEWQTFSSPLIRKLEELEQHPDLIVQTMAAFLGLGIMTPHERALRIRDYPPTREYLHAILWGCGSSPSEVVDHALVEYLQKFSQEELVTNLLWMIPWILVFPHAYKFVWTQLAQVDVGYASIKLFESSTYRISDPSRKLTSSETVPPGLQQLCHDQPTVAFYVFYRTLCLSNRVNSFFPTGTGVLHYPVFDELFKELNPRIRWSPPELDAVTSQLANHTHAWLHLLGQHLRIILAPKELDVSPLVDRSVLPLPTLLLFLAHMEKLLSREQRVLLRKSVEAGSNEQIWAIKRLQRLPVDQQLLFLVRDIVHWLERPFRERGQLTGAAKMTVSLRDEMFVVWERCAETFLTKYFEETVIELEDFLPRVSLGFLPRACLQKLYDYFRQQKTNGASTLLTYLFGLLYPKRWYSDPFFWPQVFRLEDTGDSK